MSLFQRSESNVDNSSNNMERSPASPILGPKTLKQELIDAILPELMDSYEVDRTLIAEQIHTMVASLLDNRSGVYDDLERTTLANQVINEIMRFGPIQELIDDGGITEIFVAQYDRLYVRRDSGTREAVYIRFDSEDHLKKIIDRILAPLGKRPLMNRWMRARLQNSWTADIHWVADQHDDVSGSILLLRRILSPKLTPQEHIQSGVLTSEMLAYLQTAVTEGKRVVVTGADPNAINGVVYLLSQFLNDRSVIVAVDDVYQLQLAVPNVIKLRLYSATPQSSWEEQRAAVIPNVLRLNPDALIVSELNPLTWEPLLWTTVPYIATLHDSNPQHAVQWLSRHGGLRKVEQLADHVDVVVHVVAPYRLVLISETDSSVSTGLRNVFQNDQ
jgi:pilus assembly protein CpaF